VFVLTILTRNYITCSADVEMTDSPEANSSSPSSVVTNNTVKEEPQTNPDLHEAEAQSQPTDSEISTLPTISDQCTSTNPDTQTAITAS
jgi:hypothetical protein